jgi:hypothetical protein
MNRISALRVNQINGIEANPVPEIGINVEGVPLEGEAENKWVEKVI